MYKKIVMLIMCACMILNFCACQSDNIVSNDTVTIKFSWWGGEERHDRTVEAIEKFQEKYPQIKVKVEFGEWTGFKKRMAMKIVGNEEADLMQINYDWLQTYSSDGNGFYNLSLLNDVLDLDNFSNDVLEYGKKNGIINGIPIAMNGKVLYYNKSILEKNGVSKYKTWDELMQSRTEQYLDDEYPLEVSKINSWILPMAYVQESTGRSFINDDGTLGFTEEDMRTALNFYKELVDKKIVKDELVDSDNGLAGNKVASTIGWTSDAEKLQNNIKQLSEIEIGDVPSVSGGNGIRYVKPSMLYAISKNTDHPKEAALLMNFLLNDEEAVKILGLDRGVPTSSTGVKVLEGDNQLDGIQYEANKEDDNVEAVLISPYYENTLVQNICVETLQKIIYGQASVEQCASEAYSELQKTLETIKK